MAKAKAETVTLFLGPVLAGRKWHWRLTQQSQDGEQASVVFNNKKAAKTSINKTISDRIEDGYIVDATFVDQSGGGVRAVYDGDKMAEHHIEAKDVLGPRCHELLRSEMAGKLRRRMLSHRNTWEDLAARLGKGEIVINFEARKIGKTSRTRTPAKGWFKLTKQHFKVAQAAIVEGWEGAKTLGSLPPIIGVPVGLPKQTSFKQTEAEAKGQKTRKPRVSAKKPSAKPKTSAKPKVKPKTSAKKTVADLITKAAAKQARKAIAAAGKKLTKARIYETAKKSTNLVALQFGRGSYAQVTGAGSVTATTWPASPSLGLVRQWEGNGDSFKRALTKMGVPAVSTKKPSVPKPSVPKPSAKRPSRRAPSVRPPSVRPPSAPPPSVRPPSAPPPSARPSSVRPPSAPLPAPTTAPTAAPAQSAAAAQAATADILAAIANL